MTTNRFTNPYAEQYIQNETKLNTTDELVKQKDFDFKVQVLFALQNNNYANSCFLDELNNLDSISGSRSINTYYDKQNSAITITVGEKDATMVTSAVFGEYKTQIDDFILLTDEDKPIGSEILWFISVDNLNYTPITPNTNLKPLRMGLKKTNSFRLKAVLSANSTGLRPSIKSYAMLFFDEIVDYNSGMTNPDLRRFEPSETSDVILIRDRAHQDKLVRVISPEGVTELIYDLKGVLTNVLNNTGKNSTNTVLQYGDYLNSKNKIETVLLGIKTIPATPDELFEPENKFMEDNNEY